ETPIKLNQRTPYLRKLSSSHKFSLINIQDLKKLCPKNLCLNYHIIYDIAYLKYHECLSK
ncbi:hypothetical protein BJU59_03240, partial [Wolbachia sp. wRi_2]